jgi:ankyrin repeat protein
MMAVYAAVDMNGFRGEIGRPLRVLPDRLQTVDVLRLALKHNGDPNSRLRQPILGRHHGFGDGALGEGATPLMRAAKSNYIEAMKVLLGSGADARLAMANGSNVVTLLAGIRPASGLNSADQIVASLRLLTERGANPNAPTTRGDTPLLVAARLGSNDVVRALVELGADLNATDNTGKTALDTVKEAGRNRHEDTEALLRALSAGR